MKNLNNFLYENNFTKQTGLNGLSNGSIYVSMHWSGDSATVSIDDKQVYSSSNEQDIIEFIKSEINKQDISKTNDKYDAEVMASEVAKDSEMKYYQEENSIGKVELIKNAMKFLKFELPKTIKFSDFQKLVELNLN